MTAILGEAEVMSAGAENFFVDMLGWTIDDYADEITAGNSGICRMKEETLGV